METSLRLKYLIALSLFPGVGAINSRKLLAYMGDIESVFKASKSDYMSIPGFGENLARSIIDKRGEILARADAEMEFIERCNIKAYTYLDKDYPVRLSQCEDAPIILYTKGDANLNAARIIAIVGTRNATAYGREMVESIVSDISTVDRNVIVVSGLAYGIDISAHRASLKHSMPTVGVVGHGLDVLYPSVHASVAKEMIANGGALVSDFPSKTKIDPGNFLRRNRIIAGLADCVIVAESANKGGALVTSDIANSYNREVMAVPGRVIDAMSVGCNSLIKQNKAAVIESANDLLAYMNWEQRTAPRQQLLFVELDELETVIIDFLKQQSETATIDDITRASGKSIQTINAKLVDMEFKGLIKCLPGKKFKIV